VGPVRGAEGVVHIDLGEGAQRPGEVGIVLGLAGVIAQVLEQQQLPVPELRHRLLRLRSDDFLTEGQAPTQQCRQSDRHRTQ
jgi:hypothetical protein